MSEISQEPDAETLQRAKALLGAVANTDVDVTMSVKSSVVETRQALPSHVHLSVRNLAKPGRELEGSGAARDSDFQLTHLLGHGGMGVVYEAHQCSLDRDIAIKMSRPGEAKDRRVVDKFLSEAIVTGELDHPNIVPIYDVGRSSDDALFYAMKKVVGTAWSEVLQEKTLDENLHILLAVADAVAFAHDKGVIHRDLKPQNVMLGAYGEVLLMDWGLAVSAGSDKADVLCGDSGLAGTPAYMAPEMARCDHLKIGKASDVYLLGGILYEIVTGLRPHGGGNVHACIASAMDNLIQSTEKKGELVDIALKAMSTELSQRHTSVKDFQEVLRRYLSHAESLRLSEATDERLTGLAAAPPDVVYREATEIVAAYQQAIKLWHGNSTAWIGLRRARHAFTEIALERGDLSLAGAQVDAMEAEAGQFAIADEKNLESIEDLAAKVRKALAAAGARKRLVRFSVSVAIFGGLLALGIVTVSYLMARRDRDRAFEAHRVALAERDRATAAEVEEARMHHLAQSALQQVREENYYNSIALADRKIAEGGVRSAEALLWNTADNRRGWEWGLLLFLCHRDLVTLRGHKSALLSAAFSPDGARVVTAGQDNTVVVWNAMTGVALHAIKTDPTPVVSVAFAPDGRRIRVGTRDGWIKTWDPEKASEIGRVSLASGGREAGAAMLSPSGGRAVSMARDGIVNLWNTATGEALFAFPPDELKKPATAALSADSRYLLTWTEGSTVLIREARDGGASRTLNLVGLAPPVLSACFSPDGSRIATTGRDAKIRIWDAESGRAQLEVRGHDGAVSFASFSPDGRRLVTAGHDRTARIWDAADWESFLTISVGAGAASCVALSPDGRLILAGGKEGRAVLLDAWSGKRVAVLKGHEGPVSAGAFSPDGKRVFTAGHDKTVRIWDARTGRPVKVLEGHLDQVTGLAVDPTGAQLLTVGRRGVRVWNAGDYTLLAKQDFKAVLSRQAAFGSDGSRMLVAGVDIDVLNGESRARVSRFKGDGGAVSAVVLSPDGEYVLAGDRKGARLRDAQTGEDVFVLRGQGGGVSTVAFSPDGSRLVTGGRDVVTLWDAETGRELLSLPGHAGWVTRAIFSDDGLRLVTADEAGRIRVWLGFDPEMAVDDLVGQKEKLHALWAKRVE